MSFNPEYAWGGPQSTEFVEPQMTPEQIKAYQQQFWVPRIADGGYIPPEYDNPEAMAALGQTDAYNQRMQYLSGVGAQRVATLQDRMADSKRGGIAAQAALLAGAGAGTLGGIFGGLGAGGAAAAAPAAAGLSEIGLPAGVGYLPGGTGIAGAGASGVAGGFAGAPMASLPSAISTAGGIGAFTGVPTATAGPILDGQGNEIPGLDYSTPPTGMERFQDIIGKLGGTLGQMSSAPPGGAQSYGGGGDGLAQMMQALLQRQRIQTPQVQMGARYKPYG